MAQTDYDYIIAGMGCAGLSLAVHGLESGAFRGKRVLLVDQKPKTENDRTWCFWEKGQSLFEPIVFRSWDRLWFYGEGFSKELSVAPYRYKMIRGIDFYAHCLERISAQPGIEIRYGKIERLANEAGPGAVVDGETIRADYVFNSILFEEPKLAKNQRWLLQHFKGWVVETEDRVFSPDVATLMDFRPDQVHGTAFCYVLPLAPNKALVEYTLFTPALLQQHEYDEALKTYVEQTLRITRYKICDTEFGVIPMTDYRFPPRQGSIVNIGTAGGQTKGSSGYTFYFIQKHSQAIVDALLKTGKPLAPKPASRFRFYDSVLLNVLAQARMPGKKVFSTMFQKNSPEAVLTFLNNESTVAEDVKIISSFPTLPFLKAAVAKNF